MCGRSESQNMLNYAAKMFTVSLFAELLFISFYYFVSNSGCTGFLYIGKGRNLFRLEKADGISCTGFAGGDSEDWEVNSLLA